MSKVKQSSNYPVDFCSSLPQPFWAEGGIDYLASSSPGDRTNYSNSLFANQARVGPSVSGDLIPYCTLFETLNPSTQKK